MNLSSAPNKLFEDSWSTAWTISSSTRTKGSLISTPWPLGANVMKCLILAKGPRGIRYFLERTSRSRPPTFLIIIKAFTGYFARITRTSKVFRCFPPCMRVITYNMISEEALPCMMIEYLSCSMLARLHAKMRCKGEGIQWSRIRGLDRRIRLKSWIYKPTIS